jgi:CheY-like chemotaxis protein
METLLIADDEPMMRLLVTATLSSQTCRLIEAVDGDQAWTLLREHRPTLAILDVAMPGRTGLELMRAIRADPDLRATRVIILTASAGAATREALAEAGADHFLTKPFSPLELSALVSEVLGGKSEAA